MPLVRLMRAEGDEDFIAVQRRMRRTDLEEPVDRTFLGGLRRTSPADLAADEAWRFAPVGVLSHASSSLLPSPSQGPAAAAALCELARVGEDGPLRALLPAEQPWQPSQLSATQGDEPRSVEAAAGDGSAEARATAKMMTRWRMRCRTLWTDEETSACQPILHGRRDVRDLTGWTCGRTSIADWAGV